VRECNAKGSIKDLPPPAKQEEPDFFYIRLRVLGREEEIKAKCTPVMTVLELKEHFLEEHRRDTSIFDQPDVGPIDTRNIRLAWLRNELINRETIYSYGIHKTSSAIIDMWICLYGADNSTIEPKPTIDIAKLVTVATK